MRKPRQHATPLEGISWSVQAGEVNEWLHNAAKREREEIAAWVRKLDGIDMSWEHLAERILECAHKGK